jgi:hypothetical protein
MAKEKAKIDVSPASPASTGDREARWQAYVANYQRHNPVKWARKEANGEFKTVPPTFR